VVYMHTTFEVIMNYKATQDINIV